MRTRLDSFRAAPALLAALALGAVLVLAGCGDKNLILTVDILSFLSPAETSGHYGPIPAGTSRCRCRSRSRTRPRRRSARSSRP